MNRKGLLTILLVFGFLFSVFFLFVLLVVSSADGEFDPMEEGLGVVEVTGPIMDSREALEQLERFERSEAIKGIIVRIDSPGGAVGPSQEIHRGVVRAREKKKVVISMGTMAASGGYYIACAGDRVFANPGTITGSIGVVTQLTDVSELAELAHVKVHTLTSGPYKDSGNPFRPLEEKDRAFFEQMIDNMYEQFIRDIAKGRGMDLDEVRKLADGRVYTGEQAREKGLVDEMGGLREAAEYLAAEVGIEGAPKLIYPPKKDEDFLRQLLEGGARGLSQGLIEGAQEVSAPRVEYRMPAMP